MRSIARWSLALGMVCGGALSVEAQASKWSPIGSTSTGNPVFLDTKTVKKGADGIITALVRVTYKDPVNTPQGPITASRAMAMFDCAGKKVAVKESIIYHDEKSGKIYQKRTIAQPGFGPALTSTFADVALKHLCAN